MKCTRITLILLFCLYAACASNERPSAQGTNGEQPRSDAESVSDIPSNRNEDSSSLHDAHTEDSSPMNDGQEAASDTRDIEVDAETATDVSNDRGDDSISEEPDPLPTFMYADEIIDTRRGDVNAWVHAMWLEPEANGLPRKVEWSYEDTAERVDFWPASTIKMYVAVAVLELMKEEGLSLDADVTFYHGDGPGGWVQDITMTFRSMIYDTFTCSSNYTYTLLLRYAGIDWLNQKFFTPENGFTRTALMRDYVSGRPHVYKPWEPQKIVVEDNGSTIERQHSWSGTSYANEVGCTIYNTDDDANCSSPRDMSEFLRRVMLHEKLPEAQRFDVELSQLEWLRRGDEETQVMNNKEKCGGPGWKGTKAVYPDAEFIHKGGRVSEYRLDAFWVHSEPEDVKYIATIATDTGRDKPVQRLSEVVARVMKTPGKYVHLALLEDNVNPIQGDLTVTSDSAGVLEMVVKDGELDPEVSDGWRTLPGTETVISPGVQSVSVTSDCRDESGKRWIRGRFTGENGEVAYSDLHFVIVDAGKACSQ